MRSSRKVALSVFLVLTTGALFTMGMLPGRSIEYALGLVTIGALLSFSIHSLGGSCPRNVAAWVVLGLFFSSYCVKLMLIVMHPESPVTLGMLPRIGLHNPDVSVLWMGALGLTLLGVFSFCIVLALASRLPWMAREPAQLDTCALCTPKSWWGAFSVAVGLSAATGWLSSHFDIGLMGADIKVVLPYHFRGAIFYARSYVLVGVLLLLAFSAWHQSKTVEFWTALGLLVLNGVVDGVLRSSRAAMFAPILYVFFLSMALGISMRRRYIMWGGVLLASALVVLPYLNVLRTFRAEGLAIWPALTQTFAVTSLAPFDALASGVIWVVYRLPGVEMLIGILGHPAPPIGVDFFSVLATPKGISGFLTNDMFLVPPYYPHLAAPGYFGWWYLVFGSVGVVLGGAVLALIVGPLWHVVLRLRTRTAPLIRVFFLMLLFNAASEGTLDALFKPFAAMCITILLLEAGMLLIPWLGHRYSLRAKQ